MGKWVISLIIIIAILFSGATLLSLKSQKPESDMTERKNENMAQHQVATSTPRELKIEDLKVGEGKEVKSGDTVVMNYKGTLPDGTKFDSSYDRGTPFETQIGVGQVIKGWDEGVVGMKVGGKRKLTIPPSLGYGQTGAGNVIPPNATLIFELELLEVK